MADLGSSVGTFDFENPVEMFDFGSPVEMVDHGRPVLTDVSSQHKQKVPIHQLHLGPIKISMKYTCAHSVSVCHHDDIYKLQSSA